MPKAAMHEDIGKGLPDTWWKQVRYGGGNQAEPYQRPFVYGRAQQKRESLEQENARAHKHNELYARRDKTSPVEVVAPAAERRTHAFSLRRGNASVKEGTSSTCLFNPAFSAQSRKATPRAPRTSPRRRGCWLQGTRDASGQRRRGLPARASREPR